jgi:hypothetical protein
MAQKFKLNGRALLQSSIAPGDTSFTIEASKADRFPVGNTVSWGAVNDWFKVSLIDSSGNLEIVKVGVRSSGSGVCSNVLRAQDGTTALSFAAGSVAMQTITDADIQNVLAGIFASLNIAGGLDIGTYFHAVKRAYTDVVTQAFAAALAIDASQGNVFEIADLTADVTSLTISNSTPGQHMEISVRQGGAGTYAVASPAGAKVSGAPATGVGRVSKLYLRYSNRDGVWQGFWVPIAP